MRRWWILALAVGLFVLPAIACSGSTPTAKPSGGGAVTAANSASTTSSSASATSSGASTASSVAKPTKTPVPPTQAAKVKVYGLNELVSVKNWDLAIQKVEKPGKDLVWSEFDNKSTAAGTWFVVVVDMKNTGNQNFGVNTFDFELKSGNVTYQVSDDLGAYSYSEFKGGQRIGGQVPPGVTVTYYVVFDVAPTATDLQFTFKQDKKPVFAVGDAAP